MPSLCVDARWVDRLSIRNNRNGFVSLFLASERQPSVKPE
jgi:hypothetical protein